MTHISYKHGRAAALRTLGLTKQAASRVDKALMSGEIAFKDLMPKVTSPRGLNEVVDWKRLYRGLSSGPAVRTRDELKRNRALSGKKYEQMLHNSGDPGVVVSRKPHPLTYAGFGFEQGALPVSTVHAPRDTGALLRGAARAHAPTSKKKKPKKTPAIPKGNPRVPRTKATDPTLSHMVAQHEFGEARTLRGAPGTRRLPHASHMGVEPILRENLALMGDPAAQKVVSVVREAQPDDSEVAKMYKQVGGTPDAPIPLNSRKARALEKLLDKARPDMSKETRQMSAASHLHAPGGDKQKLVPPVIGEILSRATDAKSPIIMQEDLDELMQWQQGEGKHKIPAKKKEWKGY